MRPMQRSPGSELKVGFRCCGELNCKFLEHFWAAGHVQVVLHSESEAFGVSNSTVGS